MRIAVIEHHENPSLGVLENVFRNAGAEIEIFWGARGDQVPSTADHDALVILGGAMNAADDERCPYFPDLVASIRDYAAKDRPVLGICLGAQLIARAFDADLQLGSTLEFGYHAITPTAEAETDPVLAALARPQALFQWHTDHYSLPAGALRLATNENYPNQAFRIGRATYGCQFHFEADRPLIEGWIATHSDMYDLAPAYDEWLPTQFDDFEQGSVAFCQDAARRWLALGR